MTGEFGNVLDALAQRRHRNRKHVQAVEQVLAEASGFHVGDQVAVGGGDDAHVDLYILACADRLDLAFLQLSLIHISEPTRLGMISYAVFCLKKKKKQNK